MVKSIAICVIVAVLAHSGKCYVFLPTYFASLLNLIHLPAHWNFFLLNVYNLCLAFFCLFVISTFNLKTKWVIDYDTDWINAFCCYCWCCCGCWKKAYTQVKSTVRENWIKCCECWTICVKKLYVVGAAAGAAVVFFLSILFWIRKHVCP